MTRAVLILGLWLLVVSSPMIAHPRWLSWLRSKFVFGLILLGTSPAWAGSALFVSWVENRPARRICLPGGQCVIEGPRSACGSAVAVARLDETTYVVLSAAHTVRDRQPQDGPLKLWHHGRFLATRTILQDDAADVLVLTVASADPLPIVPLADALPAPGSPARIEGFPGTAYRSLDTRLLPTSRIQVGGRVLEPDGYVHTASSLGQGVSGGPILDARGRVIGLQTWHEGDGRPGYGPSLTTLKRCLIRAFGRVPSPSPEIHIQVAAEATSPAPTPVPAPAPTPTPAAPAVDLAPVLARLNALEAENAALKEQVRGLKPKPLTFVVRDPVTGATRSETFQPGEPIGLTLPQRNP